MVSGAAFFVPGPVVGRSMVGGGMYQQRRRNSGLLWLWLALAALYDVLLIVQTRLTGVRRLDGSIGVVLGLFICSRGAGNLLDLVLFGRRFHPLQTSKRADAFWVGLNVVVLVAGCLVIVLGTTQFARAGR
jgi:hypothetical protein